LTKEEKKVGNLEEKDLELIKRASEAIKKNYDNIKFNHTVGAAVRCKNGNIYTGVNIYSIHGACAELIAIGAAITNGEREFESIVALRGENGDEILPPCGNCRQVLIDYMPNCKVIVNDKSGIGKVSVTELVPFAYNVPE
jgi:cytidine deaminase